MSNRRLDRMGFDPNLISTLSIYGITTARDILMTAPFVLMCYLDLSLNQIQNLINDISSKISPTPGTALQIFLDREKNARFISTGLKELDTVMKGGLPIGCISEICGLPGVGKTQFCFSCAIESLLSQNLMTGSSNGVVYFDTELKFDANRIIQMAVSRYPEFYSKDIRMDAPHQIDQLLGQITLKRPMTCKELLNDIENLQSIIISKNVKLIIIDSIAALARKEGLQERDKEEFFIHQASILKKIAEQCQCVVLTTNQVTPVFNSTSHLGEVKDNNHVGEMLGDYFHDQYGTYQPTLGPTWHHCVSVRLTMMNLSSINLPNNPFLIEGDNPDRRKSIRSIMISKSPISPNVSIYFQITNSGLSYVTNE